MAPNCLGSCGGIEWLLLPPQDPTDKPEGQDNVLSIHCLGESFGWLDCCLGIL